VRTTTSPLVGRLLAATLLGIGLAGVRPLVADSAAGFPTYCNQNEYACATVSVILFGNGSAHAYDDQGELDCYWNGGSGNTTCTGNYYWIRQMYPNGQLPVTVTIAPTANSWVCIGSDPNGPSCKAIGVPLQRAYSLWDLATISDGYSANLGKTYTATALGSSDGSGTITSSPSGMNCHIAGTTETGTCQASWYFKDSITVTFTGTPATGSYVCVVTASVCGAVGETKTVDMPQSSSQNGGVPLTFHIGHPIVSVAVSGQGSVVSTPAGVSCPSTCSKYFAPNSSVTLNAAAKVGYVFKSWTGACSGYGSTCNLSLASTDLSTTAVFGSPATPTPTMLPHPTATPKPGSTPAPTSWPVATPTAQRSGSPTFAVATGAPASAAASQAAASPGVEPEPTASGSAAPTEPAVAGPASSSPGPVTPRTSPGGTSTDPVDPLLLLLFGMLLLVALAVGILFGRRGRDGAAVGATPPRA
jgi:hypothetical protein